MTGTTGSLGRTNGKGLLLFKLNWVLNWVFLELVVVVVVVRQGLDFPFNLLLPSFTVTYSVVLISGEKNSPIWV